MPVSLSLEKTKLSGGILHQGRSDYEIREIIRSMFVMSGAVRIVKCNSFSNFGSISASGRLNDRTVGLKCDPQAETAKSRPCRTCRVHNKWKNYSIKRILQLGIKN